MAGPLTGKLAVILHADVAGSTSLVQRDERRAHERVTDAFRQFAAVIRTYGGVVLETRGDALLAGFSRASDAVGAALAFQQVNAGHNATLDDDMTPELRIGIALGEVVVADNTVTGAGVVLAQRVEQSAGPGGVCITGAVREALPSRLPLDYDNLGGQELKGFEQPVHVHAVRLETGAEVPQPERRQASRRRYVSLAAMAALALVGALLALAWLEPWQPKTEPASTERMAHELPDEPSIAVLPFDNLSGDPEQDFLAVGLTEEITTTLSNTPELFVIARHSTDIYKGKTVSIKQVAEEQGVRYVLEGSVQREGDRVRINAQLIDALEGDHLWAERYDRKFEDLFALQDDITHNIAVALQVKLVGGEEARSRTRTTQDPEAFRLAYKAEWHLRRFDRENNVKARELAIQAEQMSPGAGLPRVIEAWTHIFDARFGWSQSRESSLEEAEKIVGELLAVDDEDPDNYFVLSFLHKTRGEFEQAISASERAISLNPNHADAVANLAHTLIYAGRAAESIPLLEKAMRLSPYYPGWYSSTLGHAYMMTGEYDKAIEALKKGLARDSGVLLNHVRLAESYALKGDLERARNHVSKVLEMDADFTIEEWSPFLRHKRREDLELELDALRKAGFPSGKGDGGIKE